MTDKAVTLPNLEVGDVLGEAYNSDVQVKRSLDVAGSPSDKEDHSGVLPKFNFTNSLLTNLLPVGTESH